MSANPENARISGQSRFKGMLDIWHYNRPQYLRAAVVILAVASLNVAVPFPSVIRFGLWFGCIAAAYWSLASLFISHWVYDRSSLMSLDWVRPQIDQTPTRILNLHAGVDDTSGRFGEIFPMAKLSAADFFNAELMNEPSIHRARKLRGSALTAVVSHRHLPYESDSFELVAIIFAAHELRTSMERCLLLKEARRVLRPKGRIVVVEHLRDLPNFIAFGPGFLHFHSERVWRQDFSSAGLSILKELSITPFVRATLLGTAL